jgi:hypothetical protein
MTSLSKLSWQQAFLHYRADAPPSLYQVLGRVNLVSSVASRGSSWSFATDMLGNGYRGSNLASPVLNFARLPVRVQKHILYYVLARAPYSFLYHIMLDNLSTQHGQALTLLAALSAVPILYSLFGADKNRNELPYPPGPKGRFLLGNLLDIPFFKPWLSYVKMGKQCDSKRGAFVRQDD